MTALAEYLFAWNDWIVMPVLLIVSAASLARLRKASLAILTLGLFIYCGAAILLTLYPNPLSLVHGATLIAQSVGFLLGVAGFAWFWLKDRAAPPKQSNSTPHTDARTSAVPDQPPPGARAGGRGR